MTTSRALTLLVGVLMHTSYAAALNLEVFPASPRYQETVTARIVRPPLDFGVIYGATTTMQGNTIVVTYYQYRELSTESRDVTLGQFPAGNYVVQLRRAGSEAVEATAEFTVAPSEVPDRVVWGGKQVPSVNFSGQWWNPAESGWGLAITQGPTNLVFAEWFVYDETGQAVWYTLSPGAWTMAETMMTYSGPLYRTRGAWWNSSATPWPETVYELVGTGELTFRDSSTGILSFVVNGVRTVKTITRLLIE